jgi:hypothetical protein
VAGGRREKLQSRSAQRLWPQQPCTATRHRILSGLLVQATPGLWAHTAQIHVFEHCLVNRKAATSTAHSGDNRASNTTRAEANAIIVAPRAKQGQQVRGPEGLLLAGRHGLRGDRPGDRRGETRAASRVLQGELKVLSVRVVSTYYDRSDPRTGVPDAGNASSYHNPGGQAGGCGWAR